MPRLQRRGAKGQMGCDHLPERFQVVPSALLDPDVGIDGGVPRRPRKILVIAIRNMLVCSRVPVLLGQALKKHHRRHSTEAQQTTKRHDTAPKQQDTIRHAANHHHDDQIRNPSLPHQRPSEKHENFVCRLYDSLFIVKYLSSCTYTQVPCTSHQKSYTQWRAMGICRAM